MIQYKSKFRLILCLTMFKLFAKNLKIGSPPVVNDDLTGHRWLEDLEEEGQLSVDVLQTDKNIIVKSTMAGARPEDIEIMVNHDMLTIKGKRELEEEIDYHSYLYRECYWGKFSRTIILPVPVKEKGITATLANGILTVILPKDQTGQDRQIKVKQL